jgi:hypothetical protein
MSIVLGSFERWPNQMQHHIQDHSKTVIDKGATNTTKKKLKAACTVASSLVVFSAY